MFGFNLKVCSVGYSRSLILLNDWIHGPRKFQRGGWSIWLFNPSKTLLSFKKIAESHSKAEWMNMSSLGSGRPHSFSNATVLWSWNINYIRNITHTQSNELYELKFWFYELRCACENNQFGGVLLNSVSHALGLAKNNFFTLQNLVGKGNILWWTCIL